MALPVMGFAFFASELNDFFDPSGKYEMKKILLLVMCALVWSVLAVDGKYFPGVPDDEASLKNDPILDAGSWPAVPGVRMDSDIAGLLIDNSNVNIHPSEFTALELIPVQPGKLLKVTTKFYALSSQPGSAVNLFVSLHDSQGRQLTQDIVASGQNTPPEHLVWDEKYIAIPTGAVSAKPCIQFCGNPMKIHLVVLDCQTVSQKDARPYFEPSMIFLRKALSDAELDASLAKRKKEVYSVAANGDQVEFLVDGKPSVLKLYKNTTYTYHNGNPDFYRKTPELIKAGFNTFTVPVYLGVPGHARTANTLWLGRKQYQLEVLQKVVRRLLRYAPEARIMLEINVTPHPGWGEENPDEIAAHWDGQKMVMSGTRVNQLSMTSPDSYRPDAKKTWTCPYWIPSYYSEKFTRDAADAIRDILSEFEQKPESKAVVGVFFCRGTDGQWFCLFPEEIPGVHSLADYSPASLNYFRHFLREKYGNEVEALRQAWKDPDAHFDTAEIPRTTDFFVASSQVVRLTGNDCMADFIESRGKGMSSQYIALCKAVKEGCSGRILAGGYSAEGAISSWPFLTQQCGKYMHAAPEVDFLASCPGGRSPHNPVTPALANGSMRLHNMLAVTELDFRSPSVGHWGSWGESIWYKTHGIKEFGQRIMRAQLWAGAYGGNSYAYDMDGNWYDALSVLEAWKRNNSIQDIRKAAPLGTDRAAIFYSEAYWKHMALNSSRAFAHIVKNNIRLAFTRSGIDSDLYLLDDIFHPNLKAPQILCFADAVELTPEQAENIRTTLGNSGRVLIWMWAPGIGVTEEIGKVAGFTLRRAPEADGKPVMALSNSQDSLLKGVRNLLLPNWYPYGMGPVWRVDDPEAKVLGTYAGTNIPAAAVKRYSSHTEIFIGQGGNLTPELVRNIAAEAGAHVWIDSNDPAAQAGNLILISAASSGEKTVLLKSGMAVKSVPTGQKYQVHDGKVMCHLDYGDVLVIEVE